ncbi:MAG: DUF2027 domain-containing protein [Bacteroidales bacterium]|jgi:hypothetical protein
MEIKVGDKVKFLNTTGGGVVRKIIDSRLVSVAIEGGFEIPVQASELLVINPVDAGSRFFHESFEVQEEPAGESASEYQSSEPEELPVSVIRSRKSEDIFMIFVPHDQKWLITGNMDIFLVNNTSYDVIYNHFRKKEDGEWEGMNYGSLAAGTRLLIATINRDELPLWTEGCLQFLFHKNKCHEVPRPFNAEFLISGKKFYSEESYRDSLFIAGKAIIVKIASISMEEEKKNIVKVDPVSTDSAKVNSDDFILKHKNGDREAEVDLHIHELVDDPTGFEKVEILEFQKNYFIRCLESAIASNFLKVTFIHGVGNGVLREVILDFLKKQEGIEYLDAPMQKYGVGAIEVHIRHNR